MVLPKSGVLAVSSQCVRAAEKSSFAWRLSTTGWSVRASQMFYLSFFQSNQSRILVVHVGIARSRDSSHTGRSFQMNVVRPLRTLPGTRLFAAKRLSPRWSSFGWGLGPTWRAGTHGAKKGALRVTALVFPIRGRATVDRPMASVVSGPRAHGEERQGSGCRHRTFQPLPGSCLPLLANIVGYR